MSEKLYWAVAALVTVGIIYAGVTYYQPLLTALHIVVSLILLLVVLLQSGRAADLAGAFGGAGSQTAFGPRGAATFLSKATTFLAIVFMFTSLALAIFASGLTSGSLVEEPPAAEQEQTTPAPPAEPPPAPQE